MSRMERSRILNDCAKYTMKTNVFSSGLSIISRWHIGIRLATFAVFFILTFTTLFISSTAPGSDSVLARSSYVAETEIQPVHALRSNNSYEIAEITYTTEPYKNYNPTVDTEPPPPPPPPEEYGVTGEV